MKIRSRGVAVSSLVALLVGVTAAGCGNDTATTDVATPPAVPGDVVAEPGEGEICAGIDAAHSVDADPNYAAGVTFHAPNPLVVSSLYRVHSGYPISDDWRIWSYIQEKTNTTFDFEEILLADWDNSRSLRVSSGDFPTLVPIIWQGSEAAWVPGGNLLPLSQYTHCMPNFEASVAEWDLQGELDTTRAEDGNIYRLPLLRQSPNIEHSWAVNVDMFEEAGVDIDAIQTFDDFNAAMAQVQAAHIPGLNYVYTPRWNTQTAGPLALAMQTAAPNYGTTAGWNREVTNFDRANDEFIPRVATDGFRDMVAWFADLRAQGILDPEITQEDDNAVQKFINGQAAVIETNFPELTNAIINPAREAGIDLNVRVIRVPDGPAGGWIAGSRMGPGFAVNSDLRNSPYFLATLQFLDWLYYSPEGRIMQIWGIEGETYRVNADGTYECLVPSGDQADCTGWLQQEFGFRDGMWHNWNGPDDLIFSQMTPEQAAWVREMIATKQIVPINPAAPLTEAEQEQVGLVQESVQTATETGIAQFVTGQRPMSEWDSFVQQIRNQGADQIAELMTNAYHRAQGN